MTTELYVTNILLSTTTSQPLAEQS